MADSVVCVPKMSQSQALVSSHRSASAPISKNRNGLTGLPSVSGPPLPNKSMITDSGSSFTRSTIRSFFIFSHQ